MRAMVFLGTTLPLQAQVLARPSQAVIKYWLKCMLAVYAEPTYIFLMENSPHQKKMLIPGHEIVGTIVALGSEVQGFQQGGG